jgi:hypothetical protein
MDRLQQMVGMDKDDFFLLFTASFGSLKLVTHTQLIPSLE